MLEGTVLMPPSPDACRRGQIFRHLELLLVLEFLMDSRPASELPVFHQIRHVHDSFVVVLAIKTDREVINADMRLTLLLKFGSSWSC